MKENKPPDDGDAVSYSNCFTHSYLDGLKQPKPSEQVKQKLVPGSLRQKAMERKKREEAAKKKVSEVIENQILATQNVCQAIETPEFLVEHVEEEREDGGDYPNVNQNNI